VSNLEKPMPRTAALVWACCFGLYLWWGSDALDPEHLGGWPLVVHGIAATLIGAAFALSALFFIETRLSSRPSRSEPDAKRLHRRWRNRFIVVYMGAVAAMTVVLATIVVRDVETFLAYESFFVTLGAFGFRGLLFMSPVPPPRPDSQESVGPEVS
jgi:hypothetical protein